MDSKGIIKKYENAKAVRAEYTALWNKISRFTGIKLDPTYYDAPNDNKSDQLDDSVEDPTSAISVSQFGDYLAGIMWGAGIKAVRMKPSRYLLEVVEPEDVQDYFEFTSENLLYHINHERAGFSGALQSYTYGQGAFGTSGIGCFPNQAFGKGIDDNALIFRDYGVDNIAIGVGASGLVDYVYPRMNWTASRIVNEFCFDKGTISDLKIKKLPKKIQDAWNTHDEQKEFMLTSAVFPRDDFDPRLQGKKGTRVRAIWFLDDERDNIFHEDDFKEMPINIARSSRVRGEIYGRSNATMLMNSISALNFIVGNTIGILEKMEDPAMGMWDGTIAGDNVIDTSSRGVTVFNPSLSNGQPPTWNMHDVGDPTGVISFLIPYLQNHITTSSRVDAMLDFNNDTQMTATETIKRDIIRGKSLSGMLIQQKTELLIPNTKRAISILFDLGELGVEPNAEGAEAIQNKAPERVIPQEILDLIEQGKPWYDLDFNNELELLVNTQELEKLLKFAQFLQMAASMDPTMVKSTNLYKVLQSAYENLKIQTPLMVGETKFKGIQDEMAKIQAEAMKLQGGQAGADIGKTVSETNKNNQENVNG